MPILSDFNLNLNFEYNIETLNHSFVDESIKKEDF